MEMTMYTEKTIRDAVRRAVDRGSDVWEFDIEKGRLFEAVWRNRGMASENASLRDFMRMKMAATYGRNWQK
jgi:hypothetical protein